MVAEQIEKFSSELKPFGCKLIPVSKTKPNALILEAYEYGCRAFGENKVQELVRKHDELPKDIQWHFIGHLQRNKVKYIAPFVHLIHAVDSLRLLNTINKEAAKNDRVIDCLLQVHIASEESKFGLLPEEVVNFIKSSAWSDLKNVRVVGLMAMATNTNDLDKIRGEFRIVKQLKEEIEAMDLPANVLMQEISMGMTNDYKIACEEGSTMVRIGTAIFGARTCKLDG